jgi:type II secretory pathway pseudopilin PulG
MKKQHGFSFIELIIFIVVSGILATTILLSLTTVLLKAPILHQQMIANELAEQCMEWFIGQRKLLGFSQLTCPSNPTPTICSAPSGYTITNTVSCTTINGDSNYKTIVVNVSGAGDAVLTSLIADY